MLDFNSVIYNGSSDIQLTHLRIHLGMKMTRSRYLSLELNLTHTWKKPTIEPLSYTEISLSLHPVPADFVSSFILSVFTLATDTEAKIAVLLEKGERAVVSAEKSINPSSKASVKWESWEASSASSETC